MHTLLSAALEVSENKHIVEAQRFRDDELRHTVILVNTPGASGVCHRARVEKPTQPPPPRREGDISGMSAASRRRILRLFSRIEMGTEFAFISLTYNGFRSFIPPDEVRSDMKRLERLAMADGDFEWVVWKKELQSRGAIHLHLLCKLSGEWSIERQRLLEEKFRDWWHIWTWNRGVGLWSVGHDTCPKEKPSDAPLGEWRRACATLTHGVDFRAIGDGRGVAIYLSKYIAKENSENAVPWVWGRTWGVWGKSRLVFKDVEVLVIEGAAACAAVEGVFEECAAEAVADLRKKSPESWAWTKGKSVGEIGVKTLWGAWWGRVWDAGREVVARVDAGKMPSGCDAFVHRVSGSDAAEYHLTVCGLSTCAWMAAEDEGEGGVDEDAGGGGAGGGGEVVGGW